MRSPEALLVDKWCTTGARGAHKWDAILGVTRSTTSRKTVPQFGDHVGQEPLGQIPVVIELLPDLLVRITPFDQGLHVELQLDQTDVRRRDSGSCQKLWTICFASPRQ